MKNRTRADIREAVRRLAGEDLRPIDELARAEGLPPSTMIRYAIRGCLGAFLDAVHRPRTGWMSSAAAVSRFKAELEQKVKPTHTGEGEQP